MNLPGTYVCCMSGHYYACTRGDEECPICKRIDEYESLKEAVWPGKPAWRPTAEQPQQNFYEAFAESLHGQQRVARPLYEALKECERVLVDMGHGDLACAISARAAIALGDGQFDVDTVFQRMAELGITDQDIQETMPPKPGEER